MVLLGSVQAQELPPAEQPKPEARGDDAAAQDVTAAAEGAEAGMVEAFAQLADSDATVREGARAKLMGLERRYLPALQKHVERSRPLLPSQAAVLRQIVTHVYLAGEPYASDGNLGFLGVRMLNADVSTPRPPEPDPNDPAADPNDADADPDAPVAPEAQAFLASRKGVVITERMPGFVGYRMLLDGDVIVALADRPEVRFHDQLAFSAAVREVGAGRPVRFQVLRRGRLTNVDVTLDPRPEAAGDGQVAGPMDELLTRRRQKAERYWAETFAPMLKEHVG